MRGVEKDLKRDREVKGEWVKELMENRRRYDESDRRADLRKPLPNRMHQLSPRSSMQSILFRGERSREPVSCSSSAPARVCKDCFLPRILRTKQVSVGYLLAVSGRSFRALLLWVV